MNNNELEQALVLIKPDALKNSLTGYVLSLLSEFHTGLHFAATKIVRVSRMLAEEHYAEHEGKIFYPALLQYIMGRLHYPDNVSKRRVIALIFQGPGAVKKIRELCGPTNPHNAREERPGCIRSLGTIVPLYDESGAQIGERMDNLIHASANNSDAEREMKLWFTPGDMPPLMRPYPTEVLQDHYYFSDGTLSMTYEPGSICLLGPGDIVWTSDLEVLRTTVEDEKAPATLKAVVAKYLLNHNVEEE